MLIELEIVYLETKLGCKDLYASFATMSTPPTSENEEWSAISELFISYAK